MSLSLALRKFFGGRNMLLNGINVLCVDDSDMVVTSTAKILEGAGARVYAAFDGEDALVFLRSNTLTVHLILADLDMPNLDGIGLTEAIKADPELSAIPIVGLSAYSSDENRHKVMQAGMLDLFDKPLRTERLIELIAPL